MKNKHWGFINGKTSLRSQMLWIFVLTLLLSLFTSDFLNDRFFKYLANNLPYNIFSLIAFFILFITFFFLLTRHIVRYFKAITDGLKLIASGNLSYRLPLSRQDELGRVAQNINDMAERLQQQAERERHLEKSKMELITHVSHDLRTPLTSIMGYLDLLRTRTFKDEKEQERYIENAFNKTQQLKRLIDDLFEYTRLANENVQLSWQEVNFNSLLEQMIAEFEPVAKEHEISIKKDINCMPIIISMDIEKMVRALDNLLMNALKFSIKPGEIKLQLLVKENRVSLVY